MFNCEIAAMIDAHTISREMQDIPMLCALFYISKPHLLWKYVQYVIVIFICVSWVLDFRLLYLLVNLLRRDSEHLLSC